MNYYNQLLIENLDNRADKLLKTGYENGWSIDRFIFEFGMFQRTAENIMTAALGARCILFLWHFVYQRWNAYPHHETRFL